MERARSFKKKSDKTLLKILVFILMLLLLMLLLLVSCLHGSGQPDPEGPGLTIDPNAQASTTGAGYIDSGMGVSVQGFESMVIPANTKRVKVNFHNPSANEGRYYLTFELRIPNDSEQGYEVLYSSGLVLPGMTILEIEMTCGLEAGVYNAVLHVQPYRMDEDLTPVNNADLKIALAVA